MRSSSQILLFTLLSCVACGPIYDTSYQFTPPSSSLGQECVEACESSQSDCEEIENGRQEICEQQEQARMDRCAEKIQAKEHRGPKITECGKTRSCVAELSKCEARYRTCYTACGGKVDATQVCVAFCN